MSGKLKVMLPTVNLAIAVVLLGVGYMRPVGNWTAVWGQVAYSVNAPANLLRNLVWFEWDKHVYPLCSVANSEACIKAERGIETAAFLLGIALVWYFVGLEIDATGRRTRAMARFGTPARLFVDAVLVSAGGLFVFLFVANWRSMHLFLRSSINFGTFFYLAWAVALVIPYGRDLIRCIAHRRQHQASEESPGRHAG